MYLVIAEKPELGQAIAAAIPGPSREDKAAQLIKKTFNGEPITIAWSFGHLLTLYDPEDYDSRYEKWAIEDLPFFFPGWKHKLNGHHADGTIIEKLPDKQKKWFSLCARRTKQLGELLKETEKAHGTVIHAGDIDDEGQLLIDELLRYFNYQGRTQRLKTNDTSAEALWQELNSMEDNSKFVANGLAAFGRQLADKLFGYNLSRYYTIINGTKLNVGRVKMPTLGLVVQRDAAIANHQKTFYYGATITLQVEDRTVEARYIPAKDDINLVDGKILDKTYMEGIVKQLQGKTLSCTITVSEKKEVPPLPFNLTKLYNYCSNKWQIPPSKVLAITQKLRDDYNAITYNRTNCQYLSMKMHKEAPAAIAAATANLGMDASPFDASVVSRCFDDANVTEHTAMVPTRTKFDVSQLSQQERNVYEIIALYYLAQFMPPATKEITKLVAPGPNGGTIEASSTKILDPGYRALLGSTDLTVSDEEEIDEEKSEEKNTSLCGLSPGKYTANANNAKLVESVTKPPSPYTQASLISDMTSIAKYVSNPLVKKLLLEKDKGKKDEKGSIGTPATRDSIVSELLGPCGYLTTIKKGRKEYVVSTDKGREFYNILPDSVRKVDVSAKWWAEQQQIRAGEISPEDMARDVLKTVNAIIASRKGVMANAETYSQGVLNMTPICKCPKCKADMFDDGKTFKCFTQNCGFHIWKDDRFFKSIGKTLTPKAAEIMTRTGRLVVRNCKSAKTGNTFDAVVICDFSESTPKYSFASDDMLDPVGSCPWCKNKVVEKNKGFYCTGDNCKFVIWKTSGYLNVAKKTLSATDAKNILETGKTLLKNCKKKDGTGTYSAYYIMDWTQTPPKIDIEPVRENNGKRNARGNASNPFPFK